jgi:hypothetical protein
MVGRRAEWDACHLAAGQGIHDEEAAGGGEVWHERRSAVQAHGDAMRAYRNGMQHHAPAFESDDRDLARIGERGVGGRLGGGVRYAEENAEEDDPCRQEHRGQGL